jgi:hypothetical protein
MDLTGSGSWAITGLGIIGSETSGSDVRELFIYLFSNADLSEMGCEGGRWMELAQDIVQ